MQKRTTCSRGDDDDDDAVDALAGITSRLTLPTKYDECFRKSGGLVPSGPTRAERRFADSKKAGSEDGLLFDPANYPNQDERDRMLEKFFESSYPSNVYRSDGIGWIRVLSSSFKVEGPGNREDLEGAWAEMTRSKQDVDFDAIKKLALAHGYLGGIWLLFFETGAEIDLAWEKIARATVANKLGTHAKVTPVVDEGDAKELHGDKHCISVYTKDFTDRDDVMAVEGALRKMGFKVRMPFKPRIYSSLGIFAQNEWNLRPSIYVSEWDEVKQAWHIHDNTKPRNRFVGRYPVFYPHRKK